MSESDRAAAGNWETVVDGTEHRAVFVVSTTPVVPSGVLMAASFGGAAATFGVFAIDDVSAGPAGTVLLSVSHELEEPRPHTSPRLGRTLEHGIATHLAARGFADAAVSVERHGPTGHSGPVRELTEHWVEHLSLATTVSAPSHSYAARIADLLSGHNLRTLFQPVVSASTGEVVGYEALSRGPRGDALEEPRRLLEAARRCGFEDIAAVTMVHLARARAAERFDRDDLLLFVNAPPAALWSPMEEDVVASSSAPTAWPAESTVVEVTEHSPIDDIPGFLSQRDIARDQGVRFALDDAGAGYAGLGTLALLAPEFVKVDMSLVHDCDGDRLKQSVIDALVYLSHQTGSTVIAEGVESEAELEVLRALGVGMVQGFLIARPAEHPPLSGVVALPEIVGHRSWSSRQVRAGTGVLS